ncbi:hypothetical protein H4R99_003164 [Coemansia sp. RSA 1722]|nr:hypothetical protein LPJ57_001356 [Coemansia sp. RSA 486]KAJ2232077.1 hypothetical protein IWW45_005239 [Coemansia sp. RSA 485]KAJ2600950.1 hypothetical protein H4R99_003164 [Coemansia sp. RSA 1722]
MADAFLAAGYYDAFSNVDKDIRTLMDAAEPTAVSSDSDSQKTRDSHMTLLKDQRIQPPCLDGINSDDEEEATVVFLCSGLPHYEGSASIDYSSLQTAFDGYAYDSDSDDEEPVDESAWDNGNGQLMSPVTLADLPHDHGLSAYEGWIDFEQLTEVVGLALNVDTAMCRLGNRTETEYMLLYEILVNKEQWVAQIPKPSVPAGVFESEIITMAYVNENSPVPVPLVVASDFSSLNSVGVPYAIINKIPGDPLAKHWHGMDSRCKRKILDQIADVVVQLSQMRLSSVGSLVARDGELAVGPLLEPRHCEHGYMQLDNIARGKYTGPFSSAIEYYRNLIQLSLDALEQIKHTHTHSMEPSMDRIELTTYMEFVPEFSNVFGSNEFALMPRSLDLHNFIIDPVSLLIVGVVDWTFASSKPLSIVVQPPAFAFDDSPRWEPVGLEMRLRYRRNLVRYRRWFLEGLRKKAWATLGKQLSDDLAMVVDRGYWLYKFHYEISEHTLYSNPWSFRAIWEHLNPSKEFTIWFATAKSRSPCMH